MQGYFLLLTAIGLEIISTSMLKASQGFTKLLPGVGFIIGMSCSFYAMSLSLTTVPLSIAYAIWSGVGTACTTIIAILYWKEVLSLYQLLGILLIISGVILLNIKGSTH